MRGAIASPDDPIDRTAPAARPHQPLRHGGDVVWCAVRRYVDDGMAERAPAIAYYAMLSLFPALLLIFAGLHFLSGDSAADDIANYASRHGASGGLAESLRSVVRSAQEAPSPSAGGAGIVGAITAVYAASRAFTATGLALDALGARRRLTRSAVRRAQDIGATLVLLVAGLATLILLALSGRIIGELAGLVGLSGDSRVAWSIARWVVVSLLSLLLVAFVRWAAPTAPRPPFRLGSPGTLLTAAALLLEAVGYNRYVSASSHYDATYGSFAAAVILMVWAWLASATLLLGAALDVVLEERAEQRAEEAAPTG